MHPRVRKDTTLPCFSVLQAMRSWAGPGNKTKEYMHVADLGEAIWNGDRLGGRWVELVNGWVGWWWGRCIHL